MERDNLNKRGIDIRARAVDLFAFGINTTIKILDGDKNIRSRRAVNETAFMAAFMGGILGMSAVGIPASIMKLENTGLLTLTAAGVAGGVAGVSAYREELKRLQQEGIKLPPTRLEQMISAGITYYLAPDRLRLPEIRPLNSYLPT